MDGRLRVNGILPVSSFCKVCSAVSRLISWARCLPVVIDFLYPLLMKTENILRESKLEISMS